MNEDVFIGNLVDGGGIFLPTGIIALSKLRRKA